MRPMNNGKYMTSDTQVVDQTSITLYQAGGLFVTKNTASNFHNFV